MSQACRRRLSCTRSGVDTKLVMKERLWKRRACPSEVRRLFTFAGRNIYSIELNNSKLLQFASEIESDFS
jgi:hypothetical protein